MGREKGFVRDVNQNFLCVLLGNYTINETSSPYFSLYTFNKHRLA